MLYNNTILNCDNQDEVLQSLFRQYKVLGEPISLDFRKIVKPIPYGERGATHLIHTYPAKLLMHIPHFFTNSCLLSKPLDTIFDPFGGSGTVLLESILSGRNAIGSDSNPLARLIATVKTTPIEEEKLVESLAILKNNIPSVPSTPVPKVINMDHWFYPKTVNQLHRILEAINLFDEGDIRNFFLVCFSNCIKKVSLADLRVSVPVRLREDQYPKHHKLHQQTKTRLNKLINIDVLSEFLKITQDNIKRNSQLGNLLPDGVNVHAIYNDARDLSCDINGSQKSESVQLIVTSPPYAGAQKYIRSSSLSLGWLGLCSEKNLRDYEKLNIGREHYLKNEYKTLHLSGIEAADVLLKEIYQEHPLRAHIASNYLNEMRASFKEMVRVLKPEGFLVLVIANNQVRGREFRTQEYLRNIVESFGLKLKLRLIDDIHSRGLMTKRNKTASLISCEWVLVFQK